MIFEGLAEKIGWKVLDKKMTAAHPGLWPALKRAVPGWKMYLGLVLMKWPAIAAFVVETGDDVGVDPHKTALALAKVLVAVGGLHKALKFVLGFMGDDDKAPLPAPILQTAEQHDYFAAALSRLRSVGVPFDAARSKALADTRAKFNL